ncbi:phage capsid family protein [Bartonella sp. B35(2025)]
MKLLFLKEYKNFRDSLADFFADRLSLMFFIQICGYTAKTLMFENYTLDISNIHYGFNEHKAPTSKRIIRPDKKIKDEDLTELDKHDFNLNLINKAVMQAKSAFPKIKPLRVGNDKAYVLYMHPLQTILLHENTDRTQWLEIQNLVYNTTYQKHFIYNGSLGLI